MRHQDHASEINWAELEPKKPIEQDQRNPCPNPSKNDKIMEIMAQTTG